MHGFNLAASHLSGHEASVTVGACSPACSHTHMGALACVQVHKLKDQTCKSYATTWAEGMQSWWADGYMLHEFLYPMQAYGQSARYAEPNVTACVACQILTNSTQIQDCSENAYHPCQSPTLQCMQGLAHVTFSSAIAASCILRTWCGYALVHSQQ